MPRKPKPSATPTAARLWTAAEMALLRRIFAHNTNKDLASQFGRSVKSITYCADRLGLKKTSEHKAENSRKTALATLNAEHMAMIGSLGGKKGGVARAAALTPEERVQIAKKARAARKFKNSAAPLEG